MSRGYPLSQWFHGGETYLSKGDGTAIKVEGPSIGGGVFLQGGQVQHLAARAVGVDERIATITSMRADIPGIYDSSYLANVAPVSDRPALYREWLQYRIAKMKQELCSLGSSLTSSSTVHTTSIRDALDAQMAYLRRTADHLVQYDLHASIIRDYGQHAYCAADDYGSRIQRH
ncbi:hypothetical protein BDW62DRAFT_200563 [Aspergillus aurantiobrunneus]